MMLKSEFPVGLLNFFFARSAIDAEHFVVIYLAVQDLPLDAYSLYEQQSPSPQQTAGVGAYWVGQSELSSETNP